MRGIFMEGPFNWVRKSSFATLGQLKNSRHRPVSGFAGNRAMAGIPLLPPEIRYPGPSGGGLQPRP